VIPTPQDWTNQFFFDNQLSILEDKQQIKRQETTVRKQGNMTDHNELKKSPKNLLLLLLQLLIMMLIAVVADAII